MLLLETATHPFREGCSEFTDEERNAISSNLITEQVDSVTEQEAEEAFDVDRSAL